MGTHTLRVRECPLDKGTIYNIFLLVTVLSYPQESTSQEPETPSPSANSYTSLDFYGGEVFLREYPGVRRVNPLPQESEGSGWSLGSNRGVRPVRRSNTPPVSPVERGQRTPVQRSHLHLRHVFVMDSEERMHPTQQRRDRTEQW